MATVRSGPSVISNPKAYNEWLASQKAADIVPSRFQQRDSRGRWKKPEKQILVDSATGNTYAVGGKQSLDDLIQYAAQTSEFSGAYKGSAGSGRLGDVQSAADFIDFAFNKSRSKKNEGIDGPEGCHIKRLDYAGQYQLLKVTFSNNGTVIVYTRVPAGVYAKLAEYAATGEKTDKTFDGKERHLLGVEFWNMVRIRGTVHGSRYAAFYESNMNTGTRSGTGGQGYEAVAADARARKGATLGADGKVLSDAELKNLEGNSYKPLEFLYKKKQFTARELADIKKITADLSNREGTIAYALAHNDVEGAQTKAAKMVKDFLELPRISKSLKDQIKLLGLERSTDIEGEGLLRQEKFLVGLNLWPR